MADHPCGVGRHEVLCLDYSTSRGAAQGARAEATIKAVQEHLLTPWGAMTLFPPFTKVREDIGKLTQKVHGTGENGSAYCHASTFLAFARTSA